jgi:hypothetical protein
MVARFKNAGEVLEVPVGRDQSAATAASETPARARGRRQLGKLFASASSPRLGAMEPDPGALTDKERWARADAPRRGRTRESRPSRTARRLCRSRRFPRGAP